MRKSYMSLWGMMKQYETLPIIAITTGAFTGYITYFTLYFPWTRSDVNYGHWRPPLFETMDICRPWQLKVRDYNDLRTYKCNKALKEALDRMKCVEDLRKQEQEEFEIYGCSEDKREFIADDSKPKIMHKKKAC